MNIYIDIDGVLLTKKQKVPEGAEELICWLTDNVNCFWLTTHCRTGENKAIAYLKQFYPEKSMEQLKTVKATNWSDLKTEGIDFTKDFIWLEDYPFESEKKVLLAQGKSDALILVDLNQDKALAIVLKTIQSRCEV